MSPQEMQFKIDELEKRVALLEELLTPKSDPTPEPVIEQPNPEPPPVKGWDDPALVSEEPTPTGPDKPDDQPAQPDTVKEEGRHDVTELVKRFEEGFRADQVTRLAAITALQGLGYQVIAPDQSQAAV